MKKTAIFLILFLALISSTFAEMCYQETTNATDANDGKCILKYGGNYSFTTQATPPISGRVYIEYQRPAGALSTSLWQVKVSGSSAFNLTIPTDCWNKNGTLKFVMASFANHSTFDTALQCYINDTNANPTPLFYYSGTNTYASNGTTTIPLNIIDGNWNTGSAIALDVKWNTSQSTLTTSLSEEGMWWDIQDLTTSGINATPNIVNLGSNVTLSIDFFNTTRNITSVNLTVDGITYTTPSGDNLCYQETTNSSTAGDGSCGLNYTGNYDVANGYNGDLGTKAYDGDWTTSVNYVGVQANGYMNYSLPTANISNVIWKLKDVKGGIVIGNFTLPNACVKNPIQTRYYTYISGGSQEPQYYCYNTTAWYLLGSMPYGVGSSNFYEEAIQWNTTNWKRYSKIITTSGTGGIHNYTFTVYYDNGLSKNFTSNFTISTPTVTNPNATPNIVNLGNQVNLSAIISRGLGYLTDVNLSVFGQPKYGLFKNITQCQQLQPNNTVYCGINTGSYVNPSDAGGNWSDGNLSTFSDVTGGAFQVTFYKPSFAEDYSHFRLYWNTLGQYDEMTIPSACWNANNLTFKQYHVGAGTAYAVDCLDNYGVQYNMGTHYTVFDNPSRIYEPTMIWRNESMRNTTGLYSKIIMANQGVGIIPFTFTVYDENSLSANATGNFTIISPPNVTSISANPSSVVSGDNVILSANIIGSITSVNVTVNGAIYPATINYSQCYQESMNTVNQTGIDGNCGLNYNGNYEVSLSASSRSYFNISYKKPLNPISAIWKVKYTASQVPTESNLTIPTDCWNADSTYLNLSVQNQYATSNNFYCYNGTGYKLLLSVSNTFTAGGYICGSSSNNLIDGNWNTFGGAGITGYCNAWAFYTNDNPNGDIYEEAIQWNVSSDIYSITIPASGSGTIPYTFTAYGNDGINKSTILNSTSTSSFTISGGGGGGAEPPTTIISPTILQTNPSLNDAINDFVNDLGTSYTQADLEQLLADIQAQGITLTTEDLQTLINAKLAVGTGGGGAGSEETNTAPIIIISGNLSYVVATVPEGSGAYNLIFDINQTREKKLQLYNLGAVDVNVSLKCDDSSLANSTVGFCKNVKLSTNTILLPTNSQVRKYVSVIINTEGAKIGDTYFFSIVTRDQIGQTGAIGFQINVESVGWISRLIEKALSQYTIDLREQFPDSLPIPIIKLIPALLIAWLILLMTWLGSLFMNLDKKPVLKLIRNLILVFDFIVLPIIIIALLP